MKKYLFSIDEIRCVKCGACALECPVNCIAEQAASFKIKRGCIGCGDCYEICPVGAVYMVKKDEKFRDE